MSNIGERVGFDIKQMATYKIILLHFFWQVLWRKVQDLMGAYIKGPNDYVGGVGGGSEGNLPWESDISMEAYIMVGVSRT